MPTFMYRARDPSRRLLVGRLEAAGLREALAELRRQNLLIIDVRPSREVALLVRGMRQSVRISASDLSNFSRQLATMVSAGLPLVTALKTQQQQSSQPPMRQALDVVLRSLNDGESLVEAFSRPRGAFPPLFVQLLGAAEKGGMLEDVLLWYALLVEREESIKQKVISALIYPAILSVAATGAVLFLLTVLVPSFANIFQEFDVPLPLPTRMVLAFSAFLQRHWPFLLSSLAGGAWWLRHFWRTEKGGYAMDRLLLRLPIVGTLLTKRALARFCRTLAGLLRAGVPIIPALSTAEKTVGNRVIARAVQETVQNVQSGSGLSGPLLRSGVFPVLVIQMLAAGEQSGKLEQMLEKVADLYDGDVHRLADRLTSLIEPMLTLFLSFAIGFVIISIILPIFDLWGLVGAPGGE